MKVTRKQIDSFLQPKKMAIAGVSRNPKKFGNSVFKALIQKGYDVYPINPEAEVIDNIKCYKDLSQLPLGVDSLLIITPKAMTDKILKDALEKGIGNIWIQQMSETEETLKIAEDYKKEIITGKCIFMFSDPVPGIHKFHRSIMRLFGALPK